MDSTGTKNVAKEMEKISDERVRDGEKNWFPELEDKCRDMNYTTHVHVY